MRKSVVVMLVCAIAGLSLAESASAHGRWRGGPRTSLGFYFGGPLYGPWYRPFPPSFYYEPRTIIIEREPPVYIQREPAPPAPQLQAAAPTWWYCPDPAGYYPHVPSCTQQWVPVDPSTLPPR